MRASGRLSGPLVRYVVGVAVAGPTVALVLLAVHPIRPAGADIVRAVALVTAALIANVFPILSGRKTTIDVTTAAYVAMILVFPVSVPGVLALLAIAGGELLLRSDPVEALFNLGQGTSSVTIAALCFAAVRDLGAPGPQDNVVGGLAAVAVASASFHVVNTGLVAGVVARQLRLRTARLWLDAIREDLPVHAALTTLGVVAALLADDRPLALALLIFPVALVYAAMRKTALQRTEAQSHAAHQEAMARASQAMLSAHDLPTVLGEVARASLGYVGVDRCEVWLFDGERDEIELVAVDSVEDWPAPHRVGNRRLLANQPTIRETLTRHEPLRFAVGDRIVSAEEQQGYLADGVRGVAVVPLLGGEECLGAVSLYSRRPHECGSTVEFTQALARQAVQAIDRARLHDALQQRANTDELSGLLNRRAILESLELEVRQARRLATPVSVLLVDVDDLKLVNDRHGHLVGDRVLRELGVLFRATFRPAGRAGRYGGDEFLVVLPGTDADEAARLATWLVDRAATATAGVGDVHLSISVSVGGATFPDDGATWRDLVAAADAAMYAAKEAAARRKRGSAAGSAWPALEKYQALVKLARALDRKHGRRAVHSELTAVLVLRLGRKLGLPSDQLETLEIAARLHDLGKMAVPDAILQKPGALTAEEQATVRQHVSFGTLIVEGVLQRGDIAAVVAHHHERWDGRGYPSGKRGAEIPHLSRMLAIADAYAAMVQDRPYRQARSRRQAIAELRSAAGTQFDPALVEPFIAASAAVDVGPKAEAPVGILAAGSDGPGAPGPTGARSFGAAAAPDEAATTL